MPRCRRHMHHHRRHRRGPIFAPIPTPPANRHLHATFLISVPPSGGASKRALEGEPVAIFVGHPTMFNGDGQSLLVRHSYSRKKRGRASNWLPKKQQAQSIQNKIFVLAKFWGGGAFLPLFLPVEKIVAKIGGNCPPFAPEKNCVWLFPWPRHATLCESNMHILPSWPLGLSFASHLFQPLCRLQGG